LLLHVDIKLGNRQPLRSTRSTILKNVLGFNFNRVGISKLCLRHSLTFFTYFTFYQTRLPGLPPIHSIGAICWKYEIDKLLQFRM